MLLLGGDRPDAVWLEAFARRMSPVPVSWKADPSLGYTAEQNRSPEVIRRRVGAFLLRILKGNRGKGGDWVWIHNPGLGRNVVVANELARVCRARGVRVTWHHHDWWFDNRWARWEEMRVHGVKTLRAAARAMLPGGHGWMHAGINRRDAARLRSAFPEQAVWLPNPVEFKAPIGVRQAKEARAWLAKRLDGDEKSPVWLLPCRFLRRKNVAEAVLLARWIQPEAWLVTTAGASSKDEIGTWTRLKAAAETHRWRVRLSVLDGAPSTAPSVEELLGASAVVVLTSLVEGFGLPYLEAAAAGRPLVARRLGNVVPDLELLGFRFPTLYDEVKVSPGWLDWPAEIERQTRLFAAWRAGLPRVCQDWVQLPPWLDKTAPRGVPFSRLTLTGQLEVLTHPAESTRAFAMTLNPWLRRWAARAETGVLPCVTWRAGTTEKLSGRAYAGRFWRAERLARSAPPPREEEAESAQEAFIRERLSTEHLYPMLWTSET